MKTSRNRTDRRYRTNKTYMHNIKYTRARILEPRHIGHDIIQLAEQKNIRPFILLYR